MFLYFFELVNTLFQVNTFTNEFKLKATAINSTNGGCGHARLKVRYIT